ncbi:cytosine permease [Pseudonocardia eucalypti]|uniref:Cytosine permease n=1 Tax=Pseudonocardia eucalypti TaxID=648755 RepID=A0ABP9PWK5_9PSEU|nr:purine-cytosine permease-like protein [Pseudonocardia eucalypti]
MPDTTETDAFGRVEGRGIDYVPPAERHGRPRELFAIWASSNVNYLYLVLGGLLTLMGLTVWQGIAVVVAGNLFWLSIGLIAVSGTSSGTPTNVITRAMFGVRGNPAAVALTSWTVGVGYVAINLAFGSLAGFAVLERTGQPPGQAARLAVVGVCAAVTLALCVYGHATITRLSGWFTAGLSLAMLVLAGFVLAHADWGHAAAPAGGAPVWAVVLTGVGVIAAAPLSWGISADYARYLPTDSSPVAVTLWTTLGGFIPSVLLGSLGVLAGTAVDMTDPAKSLAAILPGWFYPLFLLVIVVGSVANNVITLYSNGLALQAMGVPLGRVASVLVNGLLGMGLAGYALFVTDFTSTLSNVLQLSVAFLGPRCAIYVLDIWLRRNRYSGLALHDTSPGGPIWYAGGINWAGILALALGTLASTLCLHLTLYTGPVAGLLAGADTSVLVGPLVAGALYLGLMKALYPVGAR